MVTVKPDMTAKDIGEELYSPGMAAIQAVLYAADTPYFYFVAAKDGSHRFSKNYEEHLAAVDEVAR